MRRLVACAFLAASSPALAQPSAAPAPCLVEFVRAPPEVQATIEAWVAAEPRCATRLELRVVPTTDGLYLLGRRPDGRLHERIVPDAQTAGVLVASWMAEDQPVPVTMPAPPPRPRPLIVDPFATATPTTVVAAAPSPRSTTSRWIGLAYMLGMNQGGTQGVRAELDLVIRGAWGLGVAGSISEGSSQTFSQLGIMSMEVADAKVVALGARTWGRGRWQFRIGGGLGVVKSEVLVHDLGASPNFRSGAGVFPTVELSAMVSRRLGDRWALTAGPAATYVTQSYDKTQPDGVSAYRSGFQVVMLGGLRLRM